MRIAHFLLIFMMLSIGFLAACNENDEPSPEAPIQGVRITEAQPGPMLEAVSISHDERFTIVMLGDSLTAGFGLATNEALPEQIARVLEGNGFEVNVVNAGVSGDTTAGGLARYDWSVASANPDLLIVALGANDFLNGTSAANARSNLGAILARANADGVQAILASVEAGDIAQGDPRIAEYAAIYPALAAEYDVPLFVGILEGVRGSPSLVQLDGLHPTREGVKVMAARMAKFIGPFLPEESLKE